MLPDIQSQAPVDIDPDILEIHLLSLPQAPCPVVHHFGPGVYVREVTIPAGSIAMGHKQRNDHLNIILKGSVAIIGDDGLVRVMSAPAIFVGKSGRKVGACIDECVWQNIYANPDNCQDIETLEARHLDKTGIALAYEQHYIDVLSESRSADREDFFRMLSEIGMTEDQVSAESRHESDMVDMPGAYLARLSVRSSAIQGQGLFLSSPAKCGELIAPARMSDCRTIAGRYVNHSAKPNCDYVNMPNGDIFLRAIVDIDGAIGGSAGDELTADYRQAIRVSGRMEALQ